jgi:hypothetical protein
MAALRHIHTFARMKTRKGWYRCIDPYCTAKYPREEVVGKASLCTSCGREFFLTRYALKLANPTCSNCSNNREAVAMRSARSLVKNILDEAGLVDESKVIKETKELL